MISLQGTLKVVNQIKPIMNQIITLKLLVLKLATALLLAANGHANVHDAVQLSGQAVMIVSQPVADQSVTTPDQLNTISMQDPNGVIVPTSTVSQPVTERDFTQPAPMYDVFQATKF